jgi:hypothetical protein
MKDAPKELPMAASLVDKKVLRMVGTMVDMMGL